MRRASRTADRSNGRSLELVTARRAASADPAAVLLFVCAPSEEARPGARHSTFWALHGPPRMIGGNPVPLSWQSEQRSWKRHATSSLLERLHQQIGGYLPDWRNLVNGDMKRLARQHEEVSVAEAGEILEAM